MKPSRCGECDKLCDSPYNSDEECLGMMTAEEREAFYHTLEVWARSDKAEKDQAEAANTPIIHRE